MPTVLVALATYNEIESLPPLIEQIHVALPAADVLVVDDNSPDGTGQWCDQFGAQNPWLGCIHRKGKLGLGSATYAAFRHAISVNYELVIVMDADGSHPPHHLTELVELAENVDVAIGSRYCAGGRIEGWPWRRHVASRLVNFASRWLLRLPVRDCSGSFRAYRTSKLRELDFDAMLATGYAYLEEILWRLKYSGATFGETPIVFVERRAGQSKINWREAAAAVRLLLRIGWREHWGRP
ncbi:MAG: polyprenol monophosphomannose synthase [Pirellulales bacterium]